MTLYDITVSANPAEGIVATVSEFPCTINVNTGLVSYYDENIYTSFHAQGLDTYRKGHLNTDIPSLSIYTTDVSKIEKYTKNCIDIIRLHLINIIAIYSEILRIDMRYKED